MELLSSFLKNPKKVTYQGEDRDEKVIIILRRALATNITWLAVSLLLILVPMFLVPALSSLNLQGIKLLNPGFIFSLTLFWYLFTIGFIFQNFLEWYFEVLMVTNKKIIDIDQSCRDVSETTLRNVQDVTSRIKGTWGIVLDIGDIYIQTSAEQQEFEFLNVRNPSKVRDELADLIAEIKKNGYIK